MYQPSVGQSEGRSTMSKNPVARAGVDDEERLIANGREAGEKRHEEIAIKRGRAADSNSAVVPGFGTVRTRPSRGSGPRTSDRQTSRPWPQVTTRKSLAARRKMGPALPGSPAKPLEFCWIQARARYIACESRSPFVPCV